MRIMSWNILQGGGQRADAIAAAIVDTAPGILTLQEFRSGKSAPAILNAIDQPAMILGDLNCGIPFEDSETKSFANTHLFQLLSRSGWIDAWRSRNPAAREFTWVSPRGNG